MSASQRAADIEKLRQLASLVTSATEAVIAEWTEGETTPPDTIDGIQLPSHRLYGAQRILAAAAGSIEELVCDPSLRLLNFSTQYVESRALHIAAEHRIADLLEDARDSELHVQELAKTIGIETEKLSRILRLLTSQHIFREVRPDIFANNAVSRKLVRNETLRAYIMNFAADIFSTMDYLPMSLKHPVIGPSYKVNETAFNLAVGTSKPRWEWLEEKVPKSQIGAISSRGYPHSFTGSDGKVDHGKVNGNDEMVPRPGLEIMGLAMVGGGRVHSTPHVFDYPWGELGNGTVVDVGGGQGGFLLQLSRLYPNLRLVLQDRQAVIEKAKSMWKRENPDAVNGGKVEFVPHDFFQSNPVKNADVYFVRNVIHDWSDSYCISILSNLRAAMGPQSRVLIADQVMNTTLGSPELKSAPEPLLANYGNYVRFSHQRDVALMGLINGIERTPAQFRRIVEGAGLRLVRPSDILNRNPTQRNQYRQTSLSTEQCIVLQAGVKEIDVFALSRIDKSIQAEIMDALRVSRG
ncbi:hypothetical protein DL767_005695 [Monosporascus sp. MG133]|nr:hypothetical protein DL767_005695 [Monosporascus sp. MG133]